MGLRPSIVDAGAEDRLVEAEDAVHLDAEPSSSFDRTWPYSSLFRRASIEEPRHPFDDVVGGLCLSGDVESGRLRGLRDDDKILTGFSILC